MFILKKLKKYNEEVKHMKTIKKAIALVLTALMVLSLVPAGVSAIPAAGMTLAEFKAELTPRMESFYANITPEQSTILKAMGDSLNTSTLSPYTTVDGAWTTILGSLVTPTLITKYGSTQAATAVLAKMVYSTMELMFYMDTTAGTDSAKLDAAITNAYDNLYLPMDELAGHAFTQSALSSILTDVKGTISSQLSSYANDITSAMNASASTAYVNTIANKIASVAVTYLFNHAVAGSTLETLKNNFATNAGFTTTDLGTLVQKIYVATASVSSAQKAPAVQFNLLINSVITFQGAKKDTSVILPFDQAISLSSATEDEVYFKINPNRTIAGIELDMTSYFEVSSPDNNIISATKYQDPTYEDYYIKLKAMPNVTNGGTYYVNVYRKSVTGENYFFNVKVNVVAIPANTAALTTAITTATTLIGNTTVGTAVGNVPQSANTAFQTAIDTATAVKNDANATQDAVDAAVLALAAATTTFNNAVILAIPKNVLVKKVADANFSMAFETIALASAYVKAQADSVKLTPADKTVMYYAVPNDGITPITGKNVSVGKLVVCDELGSNSIIPDGAVVWASTQEGTIPVLSLNDYYTKGVNAFPTILEAYNVAEIGAEIVIKDGTYEAITISKKVFIRNGSNPIITGAMIIAAAAAGTTIEGITLAKDINGNLASITVDAPNVTIANLDLNAASLIINNSGVAIQNVTSTNSQVNVPVITINVAATNTTISGFTFVSDSVESGAAITVAPGAPVPTIKDSIVPNSSTTINIAGLDTTTIYSAPAATPAPTDTVSNTTDEKNNGVVLHIRQVASADPTKIRTTVYLTGIDSGKDVEEGHAVIGYTFKTITGTPTIIDSSDYHAFYTSTTNPGLIEVAYNRNLTTTNTQTHIDTNDDGVLDTYALDLFNVDFPIGSNVGDIYSIWLSTNSPNNKLMRSITSTVVPGADINDPLTDKQTLPYPMIYTVSSDYILKSIPQIPKVTLTVWIELPFEVKDNADTSQQFYVNIVKSDLSTSETYQIYTNAPANPFGTHTGATLVSTAGSTGFVSGYTLTLPNYVQGTQYSVSIIGSGYTTVTYTANLENNLLIHVWNNIRSISGANFLAGDVSNTDDDIPALGHVNDSDFSAMASAYGTNGISNGLRLYDINRDLKVDLKDIAYLLLNRKTFRLTY